MTDSLSIEGQTFSVKVGEFEGPLELLLNLVEEKRLHINQVSLATVADSFLAYLKELSVSPNPPTMAVLGNFAAVASTLILIKSISLLPNLPITAEEEEQIGDLELRLKLYHTIKKFAAMMVKSFSGPPIFYRQIRFESRIPIFSPTGEITFSSLEATIGKLINDLPRPEIVPSTTVKRIISIEAVIGDLTKRVQSALSLSFSDFVKDKKERIGVIVSFLALLELFKQGIVNVTQTEHFSEIKIETTKTEIPKYG